jgi:hypothetical protein
MTTMVLVLLVVQILTQVRQVPQVRSVQQVHLHHLHYRVADPLAGMKTAGGSTGSEPVILQGIGVGVRSGSEFLLFDRSAAPPSTAPVSAIATSYQEVLRWLTARGFAAPTETGRVTELALLVPGLRPDHIALSVDDLLAAVERVQRAGIRVTWRNDASATFRIRTGGPLVEFVRDLDQPDVFWCTMHPDVRSAVPGTCPFCKMTLVPIPPPRIGEYRVDLAPIPAPAGQGLSGLGITIRDPDSGAPVSALATVHDKPLHLFVVSRALDYFAHLHPVALASGSFEIRHAIPPGEYMVVADFLPQGGSPQLVQHAIVTAGFQSPTAAPAGPRQPTPLADVVVDGVRGRIEAGPITAGQNATMRFTLTHASSGAPVSDLQPYLAAPAHLFLVSTDLTYAVHGHPAETMSSGPELSFTVTLPALGAYKLWLQVQRRGRVITLPFVVEAR